MQHIPVFLQQSIFCALSVSSRHEGALLTIVERDGEDHADVYIYGPSGVPVQAGRGQGQVRHWHGCLGEHQLGMWACWLWHSTPGTASSIGLLLFLT